MTRDRTLAALLFVVAFVILFATEQSVGFVRDESVYAPTGERYAEWTVSLVRSPTVALTDKAIVDAFGTSNEHPVLMKFLFGLSHRLFHQNLGWMRPGTAFRFPALLIAAAMLPLLYFFARKRLGKVAAVFAALSWLAIPRQFFHSHLACFDVPVAVAWLFVVYCFVEAQERPRYWLYTGIAFGFAMATKHNAFFLPIVLAPLALYRAFRATGKPAAEKSIESRRLIYTVLMSTGLAVASIAFLARDPIRFLASNGLLAASVFIALATVAVVVLAIRRLSRLNEEAFRAMASLASMAVLGPLIFYLHWPYLWHSPLPRVAWYISFHMRHEHYPWFYLNDLLRGPPFPLAYVVVLTALTVPTSLFLPMVLGFGSAVVSAIRKHADWFTAVMLANAIFPIALISLPSVPHFGGVKHWLASMPFLLVFAGVALERGAAALAARLTPRLRATVAPGLAALALLPAVIATARIHPYGTSAYSELAGGLPGAATLGMQRQYWANNVSAVVPWIRTHARPGDRVYLHENHGGQVYDYIRNGMLPRNLRYIGSPEGADIVAYQYHQEFRNAEFETWQSLGTTHPVYGLYLDETPQIIVYQRPR